MIAKGSTSDVTVSRPTSRSAVYEVSGIRVADVAPSGGGFHVRLFTSDEDYSIGHYFEEEAANDRALRHALRWTS